MSLKECPHCGEQVSDSTTTCELCGCDMTVVVERENSVPDKATKVTKVTDRVKEFENKHNIILNLVIMVCAIVVMFVALFAPIKVPLYSNSITETKENEASISYVSVNQSVFQLIGTISYIKPTTSKKEKIAESYAKASEKVELEYSKWVDAHLGATEEEASNALTKITADCMSEINILGYMMSLSGFYDFVGGIVTNAVMSAILGIIIAVLSLVMAGISLYFIILAIVNMVGNKPQNKLYKYFARMLTMSSAGIILSFCAPMLKSGGGMFVNAIFIAVLYLICVGIGQLFFGKTEKRVVIKQIIIAAACIVAFFLLCGNIFTIVNTTVPFMTTTTSAPSGYGLYSLVGVLGIENAPNPETQIANSIIGFIMYIFAALVMSSCALQAMNRSLNRLVLGDAKKTTVNGSAIAAAVIMLITIIIGFISDTMAAQLLEWMLDAPEELIEIGVRWLMNPQVWVSMILLIGVVIFNKVYLPNDCTDGNSAPQTVQQELPEITD